MYRLHLWFLRHPVVGDALWALVLLLLGLRETVAAPGPDGLPQCGGLALGTVFAGLVLLRRRYPDAVTSAVVLLGAGTVAAGAPLRWPDLGFLVLLRWAAFRGSVRAARIALAAAVLAGPALVLRAVAVDGPVYVTFGELSVVAGICSLPFVLAWGAGVWARARRAVAVDLTDRARRAREDLARTAVRARMAAELHDVIAHDLTAMTVQAGAAGHVLPAHPGLAGEAARGVGELGRRVLAELDRLERVLRA
ncbi:hypothetical protein GCM10020229_38520 [Kitasatospora albolonga]|uniref:histidine kinase dimerization/phosphoacceptor domain-containing protein n=1 Tax=Kitasatospora albolonga TaxID=68173 RepID=UPI0031E5DCD0